jgi:hypothetical protein
MQRRPSHHLHRQQRDLFEPNKPPVILDRDDRLKLVPLVQALLTESLTPPPPTSTEEAGDDQAHP